MHKSRFLLAAGVAMAFNQTAFGQTEAPSMTADAAAQDSGEIIVTARRTSERLQETPVAVTAITARDLTEKSVVNVQDLVRLAPSLALRGGGGSQTQSYVSIRGIGQASDNPALEAGVGIYIDNVFIPRSQAGLFDLNDVAQIEVLRGPQGTLYGKNTIGGAVKVTSNIPVDTIEGHVTVGYGNFDEKRLAFAVNTPLTDKIFVRASGTMRNRNGYSDNPFDGRKLGDISAMSGRLMLRALPADGVEILLSVDGYHDRSIDVPNRLLGLNSTDTLAAIEGAVGSLAPYVYVAGTNPSKGGGSDIRFDPDIRFTPRVDQFGTSLQLAWEVGDATIKSITAYRKLHAVRTLDVDGTPLRVLNVADEMKQHQFSQELQVSGELSEGRFEYLGGLFYYDEEVVNDSRQTIAPLGVRSDRLNDIGTKSAAAYLNLTFNANDRLSATLGGRYTWERRSLGTILRTLPTLAVTTPRFSDSANFSDFSPKAEIDYKITPDIFVYASAAKGFKSGGFNSQASNIAQLVPYDPETAWNYEIGAKTQLFDRRLTLNVAAFYTDYKDLQLNVFREVEGVLIPTVSNAGRAKIGGVEVEASARLTPAFTIYGNFSYNDSHYDEFQDAQLGDLSDKKLLVAKYKYLIGAQYLVDLGGDYQLRFNGDYGWKSSMFSDTVNSPILHQPSYGLLNARAAFVFGQKGELAVFGRNLTNERPLQGGSQALTSLGLAWGNFHPPRTYGVEASWKF